MVAAPFVEPERRSARFGYFAESPKRRPTIRFTRMNHYSRQVDSRCGPSALATRNGVKPSYREAVEQQRVAQRTLGCKSPRRQTPKGFYNMTFALPTQSWTPRRWPIKRRRPSLHQYTP
jgi:hypothetical protein